MAKFLMGFIVLLAVAPICMAADWSGVLATWDSATDTTWSVSSTNGDTSLAFFAWPDMSIQSAFNSGTTSDSIKMFIRLQFNPRRTKDGTVPGLSDPYWTDTVAGYDSIGYVATADSTACTAIGDASTDAPVYWARVVISGYAGNRVSAAITGQTYILRYK